MDGPGHPQQTSPGCQVRRAAALAPAVGRAQAPHHSSSGRTQPRLQPADERAGAPAKPWHRHRHAPQQAVPEVGEPDLSSSGASSRSHCSLGASSPRSVLPRGHQRYSGHASLTSLLSSAPLKPPVIDRVARYQCDPPPSPAQCAVSWADHLTCRLGLCRVGVPHERPAMLQAAAAAVGGGPLPAVWRRAEGQPAAPPGV